MFINEDANVRNWSKMLTEQFNVTDSQKLDWVSQYAANHEFFESVQAGHQYAAGGFVGARGPIYSNPLNTIGMGNPAAPQNPNVDTTDPSAAGNFWNQTVGSGDIPVSTLPMSLNVALMTIGLELLPVIPAKAPWQTVSYLDFPYAGGKLRRSNETAFDGVGDGDENKPIYVKFLGDLAAITDADFKAALEATMPTEANVTVEGNGVVFTGKFKGFGRNDGGIILQTVSCVKGSDNAAITELFGGEDNPTITVGDADPVEITKADFVQTSADLVDGFANFATGKKEAMTRAQNETGTGNTIGLRIFSKMVQCGAYEVTGSVTRQQLQDLPLYGIDPVAKLMEQLQNELTQHINQRILERVFRLGVTNAVEQKAFQGVDLNLYIGTTGMGNTKPLSEFGVTEYTDIYGTNYAATDTWKVKNSEANTSAENQHTRQRRIYSRVLAATNLIQAVGRRGRATWVVTNAQVASALQDVAGYVVAPMANTLSQDGTQDLYHAGTVAGLKIYVDPYMKWNDNRVCVGRKGDGNSPGVIFMPYILADQVSITAEGTMSTKMLVNSRFALTEIGFYPEQQYYTFCVFSDFGII